MNYFQNYQTNWKYILIIIILAVIVGGGVLAYQYWWLPKHEIKPPEITIKNEIAGPDLSEVEGWQIYTNSQYGFEVKYPSDVYFKEFAVQGPIIAIGIKENNYSLMAVYVDDSTSFGKYCDNQKNFSIDNSPAQKCYFEECADFCHEDEQYYNAYSIEILQNNLRYSFICSDLSHESLCDQILSTFKFIGEEDLTSNELKNADYYIFFANKTISLQDGNYQENLPGGTTFWLGVTIYKDKITFGDINNDQKDDAAVILNTTGGGSGQFRELTLMINRDGKPLYLTGKELGDRVIINSVNIVSGEIILDMIVHGPNDGLCCPTVKKIIKYKLLNNELVSVD